MGPKRRHPYRAWAIGGLCAIVTAAFASTAVAAGTGHDGARAGSITLYSGQHEQTVSKLVSDFGKRTGIRVDVRSADEATLANQIMQEGSKSPADVFLAENAPALQVLAEKNLLAKVAAATLDAVPHARSSPSGSWVAVSARAAVLVYNTGKLKPAGLPRSLLDLASPRWKGKLAIAPGETDFQPLITSIARLRGNAAALAWLKAIKRNAEVMADNEAIVAAVNQGTVLTGLVDHYYWYRLRDEVGAGATHSAVHYFAPRDPGMLVDVSGAAVLKSSKDSADAQRFLAYLVSKPAQTIIATSESYEYPLRPGVTNHRVARSLGSIVPANVNATQLGDGKAALAMLQQVGLL
ncbi:MAG TPA: iron ABC transporter substrate-binding protein [Gaiellales bacterium]|nr:iron ABC transporter substrate-binding protein [Gaiellales bacterium]